MRVGIGTDVHRLSPEHELWLGGVHWPGEPGLVGHSDGDCLAHAIVDAVLSAAGLGDIGSTFGTDRPEFAGASGIVFLTETARLIAEARAQVQNVSVQVIANGPKIGSRRQEIESVMSAAIEAPVSVSGTTSDGLGLTGRGEGVAAIAVALVEVP